MRITADYFAALEFNHYTIYKDLAARERDPEFRRIMERFAAQEFKDYSAWRALGSGRKFQANRFEVFSAKLIRRVFGLTFLAKYLKRKEDAIIHLFERLLVDAPSELRSRIQESIAHEHESERELIGAIKEEKVAFIGNVILGLNDGLIELTGAMVGFSFALVDPRLVALTGSITGIAASLSMASSAYMQAKHEENGRNPRKAAAYTGIAYFIVVALLILPFLTNGSSRTALAVMFGIIIAIIASISYYTAVLFERGFGRQFREMLAFSIGVAAVSFGIGTLFRRFTGFMI